MSELLFPIIALFVTIIGIISGVTVRIYLASKKENNIENFDKGSLSTQIKHFKEKFEDINKKFENIDNDIENERIDHDSIQRQFADIRDRVGTIEGMIKGLGK